MQKYVLSELDSGERVISEKVASVRSVSVDIEIIFPLFSTLVHSTRPISARMPALRAV